MAPPTTTAISSSTSILNPDRHLLLDISPRNAGLLFLQSRSLLVSSARLLPSLHLTSDYNSKMVAIYFKTLTLTRFSRAKEERKRWREIVVWLESLPAALLLVALSLADVIGGKMKPLTAPKSEFQTKLCGQVFVESVANPLSPWISIHPNKEAKETHEWRNSNDFNNDPNEQARFWVSKLYYHLVRLSPFLKNRRGGLSCVSCSYTFTLTFAVQDLVNTFGDLRGAFAAVERINSIFSGAETDEALAYGLEKEIQRKSAHDEKFGLFVVNGFDEKHQPHSIRYMSDLTSLTHVDDLTWSCDIRLENVHFSYPSRPDVEVLSGLNLTLKCGTVTALVGSSGAGKSTIVQLLARFYEPTSGHIIVGGEDIRTFDKSEWAQVVSIVNQDPVLFSVSVGENIAYGLPDANVSEDDVIKAAKAANAHEFIIALPQI